jgi:aspartate 1-decarboxylase
VIRTVLKSKLYELKITDANIKYDGSIAIDKDLLRIADIWQFEQVHVLNVTNGKRFITYAIDGNPGEVCVYGAAAKLVDIGDELIVLAYAQTDKAIKPKIFSIDSYIALVNVS